MSKKDLASKLRFWRCDRPDEWIMDEFIKDADALKKEIQCLEFKKQTKSFKKIKDMFSDKACETCPSRGVPYCDGCFGSVGCSVCLDDIFKNPKEAEFGKN